MNTNTKFQNKIVKALNVMILTLAMIAVSGIESSAVNSPRDISFPSEMSKKKKKSKSPETRLPSEENPISEQLPTFRGGGVEKFAMYVAQNVKYPAEAMAERIQGTVFIQFVVNEKGHVVSAKAVSMEIPNTGRKSSMDPHLVKEAMRVVESSPKWSPGIQGGVPKRVNFTVPVTFRLRN